MSKVNGIDIKKQKEIVDQYLSLGYKVISKEDFRKYISRRRREY